jgi:hypothetical protein
MAIFAAISLVAVEQGKPKFGFTRWNCTKGKDFVEKG